jgi:hypothetical protein
MSRVDFDVVVLFTKIEGCHDKLNKKSSTNINTHSFRSQQHTSGTGVVVVTGGGVGTGIVVAAGSSSGVGALFMDWRFGKVDESS